jgi:hypothetical protein
MIKKIFLKRGLLLLMAMLFVLAMTATPAFAALTWQPVGNPDFSSGEADCVSLSVYNGTPYVAYQDGYQGPATVQECISGSWQPVGKSDFSAGGTDNNAFYLYNGTPYVAYTDYTDNGKATVMMFDGANWVDVGAADFSAWSATSISLYVYDNNGTAVPYVAYSDWSQPHYNVTVEKYTGANWVDVGNAGFSKGAANCTSLAVDNNGTPYVAYDDEANSEDNGNGPATVMNLDGSTWVNVGTADFSGTGPDIFDNNDTSFESLAIDNNGTPYVAYQDGTNGPATVAEYTSTTGWQFLGGRGFTSGHNFGISNGFAAVYESLYISNDTPYLAYNGYNVNGTASDSINVVEYNSVSSSWQDVGSTAPDSGAYISLYVSNGTPYVAFKDGTHGHKATVIEDVVPQTPTPIITTPVYAGATSVSGTAAANASIVLSVSGTAQPAVTAGGSGNWTVSGLSLSAGDTVSVTAQAPGDAVSQVATAIVQASPPTVVSAVTSTDGSKITVTFSKAMDAPPAAPAGFGVWGMTGDFAEFPTGVVLDSDTSAYDLTLSTPVAYGDEVSLSYNGEVVVQSEDGGTLAGFNEQSVTNNVAQASPPTGSATIDPGAGGTISLPSGQASVSIPAGALQGTTGLTVTITQVSATAPPGFKFLGTVYQFTVGGLDSYTFNIPVTLTFSFNPSRVPSGVTPAIYYYDDTTGQWVNIGGTVNWTNDTITVTVDHFTNYAVMYPTFTTPGGVSGGSESFPLLSVPPSYFEGLK